MSEARDRYYDYQRLCPNSGFIYAEEITNYVSELEQQNNELMEFAKEMREIGKLNPDRLPEYTDIIYHHANDLITRITGVIL